MIVRTYNGIKKQEQILSIAVCSLLFKPLEVITRDSPPRGDMGTAGFGAVLAHRRPILDGGFSPDGFGSEDGRTGSVLEVATVDVDDAADVELVSDILSEDGAGTGAGDGSTEVS